MTSMELTVVFAQQEYYVSAAVEPDKSISIELLQCQLMSILGLLPDEQILVTSQGDVVASPYASMALSSLSVDGNDRLRLFLFDAKEASNMESPVDWREICSRCVFGDTPVVQPAFRRIGSGDSPALICQACAQTCSSDSEMVTPLEWRASTQLPKRFISEIRVVAGEADVPVPAGGFEKVAGDLNYSASGDYVHLFVKRGGNRLITQLHVEHTSSQASTESSLANRVNVHCNAGNGSATGVFLGYQTASRFAPDALYTQAIADVRLCVGDEPVPSGYIKITRNLNEGAPGKAVSPLFLCYRLCPTGGFTCAMTHGAFGECLFQSRHASDNTVVASGTSPSRDAVAASLDEARQRADNTYFESFYRQNEPVMRRRLQGSLQRVGVYEDPQVQAEALKHIPVEKLHERAKANPTPWPSYQDELVMQLTHWFKREFFTWMNQPKCGSCGFNKTGLVHTEGPSTPEERAGDTSRVEVYQCPQCRNRTRFPRYNDPVKLLETRTGRCGEWANCFTLCCRAMGFEARYVLDVTDHVWTEVYSAHEQRWLHCDPCEDQLDCPLTYEVGWGKKLSYIFSFSHEEVVDTARRYTQDYDAMLGRRNDVSESWLAATIAAMNQTLLSALPADRRNILEARAVQEQAELTRGRVAKEGEVHGRVSGSDEWKSQRKEDGSHEADASQTSGATQEAKRATATRSKAEIAQMLCKNLLVGCDRSADCVNPYCLHQRARASPEMSPTDRAAQALQFVSSLQQAAFSAEGLSTLLCPVAGNVRDCVLHQKPRLYLPLQDGSDESSDLLVDCSGHEHHVTNPGCPLQKPFIIPSGDGKPERCAGLQLLGGQTLVIPLKSENTTPMAFSWLMRINGESHARKEQEILTISVASTLDLAVITAGDKLFRIVLRQNGSAVQWTSSFKLGMSYHVALTHSSEWRLVVNAKEEARLTRGEQLVGTTDVVFSGPKVVDSDQKILSPTPVITHFAVLPVESEQKLLQFCQTMKEKYVSAAPLQAIDHSGSPSDKTCELYVASLQSGFRVARVRMWGGEFFDGIQLVYEKESIDGSIEVVSGSLVGNRIAHRSANAPTTELTLLPNEYLTGLVGRKGAWMDCFRVETNFGRSLYCGGSGGNDFRVRVPAGSQIRAIAFDVGDHLADPVAFVAEAPGLNDDPTYAELKELLKNVDTSKCQAAISAACRYLENIASTPSDPKFQSVRATNKFFVTNIGNLAPATVTSFMAWCGFTNCEKRNEDDWYIFAVEKTNEQTAAKAYTRLYYLKQFK
ncbi:hypothetical protein Poli38472_008766 [Pythium oligandrum]|uniref:MABP domain-containing protein n=1 Tax=Pythium oligandrum TaxID=41045 RepID=A0A8K1C471_PYTOL|nr:hypothetical protein Poli38472_008766 [Pythium oligandrum]|eukprot:TMW56118.1 hypothetical protein Poli38472_008766 [Pythium oligandrum]